MKLYSIKALETTIASGNWDIEQLNEGSLLGGDYVLRREGYKTMVVYEHYLNAWSSAYQVKRFDETKEKSRKALYNLIEKLRDMGEEDV